MDLAHPTEVKFEQFVQRIASHVRCELSQAVKREWPKQRDSKRNLLKTWVAEVGLTITADDKGQANPGIAVINAAQTFTTSAGAQFMADGTRVMSVTYFVPFQDLVADPTPVDEHGNEVPCEIRENEPIAHDLGIHQTLSGLSAALGRDGHSRRDGHRGTLRYDLPSRDIPGSSGSQRHAELESREHDSTGGTLLSATRTRTDELLITFGPGGALRRPRIRVDLPTEVARATIVPALPDFMGTHPEFELELSSTDRQVDLVQEGFDCVLRLGPIGDETLIARPLGLLRMVNAASPAYL